MISQGQKTYVNQLVWMELKMSKLSYLISFYNKVIRHLIAGLYITNLVISADLE